MIEVVGNWLEIDGERLGDSRVCIRHIIESEGQLSGDQNSLPLFTSYGIEINSPEAIEILISHKFKEISNSIATISYKATDDQASLPNDQSPLDEKLTIRSVARREDGRFYVAFFIRPDLFLRNIPYSLGQYLDEVAEVIKAFEIAPRVNIYPLVGSNAGLTVNIPPSFADTIIKDEIDKLQSIYHACHQEAIKNLTSAPRISPIEVVLDLPAEVKVACKQYLLYFVQFLSDLGIEANSEIRDEAGQVLFAVMPKDKDEALDKIRGALEVYLCLPSGKLAASGNEPIEIQRLTANILHLQSQLMLAQATIQHKDAAIQFQQATIQRQQFLLAENVITQSVVDITSNWTLAKNSPFLDSSVCSLNNFRQHFSDPDVICDFSSGGACYLFDIESSGVCRDTY